jgi:dTMP kinase
MESGGRGKFFVIEGIDGSGKSTQIKLLQDRLLNEGFKVHITFEPTDNSVGKIVRSVINKEIKVSSKTLAALFLADRIDHIESEVHGMLKMVEEGITVISDRYYWSSYAYHSLDDPMEWVVQLNDICKRLLKPDFTFFLDIPVDTSLERIEASRNQKDLFEKKEVLTEVRQNYLQAFKNFGNLDEYKIIDANRSPDQIFEEIWSVINKLTKA